MPEDIVGGRPSAPEVRSRLLDTARLLRDSATIHPDVRGPLAELLDELGRALEAPDAPPAEVSRLAEGVAHLTEALHHGHDQGVLEAARDRLEGLVVQAEARAPTTVGLLQRVIDALSNFGI
ncbi:MAG: DUF4404 family protein [Gemmataceae bacterium]